MSEEDSNLLPGELPPPLTPEMVSKVTSFGTSLSGDVDGPSTQRWIEFSAMKKPMQLEIRREREVHHTGWFWWRQRHETHTYKRILCLPGTNHTESNPSWITLETVTLTKEQYDEWLAVWDKLRRATYVTHKRNLVKHLTPTTPVAEQDGQIADGDDHEEEYELEGLGKDDDLE